VLVFASQISGNIFKEFLIEYEEDKEISKSLLRVCGALMRIGLIPRLPLLAVSHACRRITRLLVCQLSLALVAAEFWVLILGSCNA